MCWKCQREGEGRQGGSAYPTRDTRRRGNKSVTLSMAYLPGRTSRTPAPVMREPDDHMAALPISYQDSARTPKKAHERAQDGHEAVSAAIVGLPPFLGGSAWVLKQDPVCHVVCPNLY